MTERLGVLGAGTMGAGIAQVAAEAGMQVLVHDPVEGAWERASERIAGFVRRRVEKGQLDASDAEATLHRIGPASQLDALGDSDVIVEAIPEDLELKRLAFAALDRATRETTILATNTSSLPVAGIASATGRPERVIGMHFFNPVPLMPLVEVVAGPRTSAAVRDATVELVRRLGKTPVIAADTPGFIVNRVARPFYLEALRMLGEGVAGVAEIDAALRDAGFRMGPFELVDTIGLDVNLSVSESVHAQFFGDPRYRPHPIQRRLVDAGRLGRKSGGGYYDWYGARRGDPWPPLVRDTALPAPEHLPAAAVADRVVATIVNEAASAVEDGIATPDDIDTAMRLGAGYPRGPLAWGQQIGLEAVVSTLDDLHARVPDGRYRVTPLLRELARRGASFLEAAS